MNSTITHQYLQTEFLRALAHTLRTPVGVADGALRELRAAPGDDAELLLAMAERNLAKLTTLAKRLDWVAELEEGGVSPEFTACHVSTAVRDAVRELEPWPEGLDLAVAENGMARADPVLLRRVLTLVLDNARRFAERMVRVAFEVQDGLCVVIVDDDGKGIDPAKIEDLFDRYRSGRERGCDRDLAFGLSLARDYVHAMDGEISLAPGPQGRGTRCRITLPVASNRT